MNTDRLAEFLLDNGFRSLVVVQSDVFPGYLEGACSTPQWRRIVALRQRDVGFNLVLPSNIRSLSFRDTNIRELSIGPNGSPIPIQQGPMTIPKMGTVELLYAAIIN